MVCIDHVHSLGHNCILRISEIFPKKIRNFSPIFSENEAKNWPITPNAGPTQTHAGCRWTPYDFLDHVDYVFLKDNFVVFQSNLQRCVFLSSKS